ncbi:hypothetical protein L7F22_063639 [Adiantum nelumboides]|nr:hypothetical protein [Adiantum nelumboides]
MNRVRVDLKDKAKTFIESLVNVALVSHLKDLENADDDKEEEDDEDKDDQVGTSRHPGPDDDNDDDQD